MKALVLIGLVHWCLGLSAFATPQPLSHAHAHNDYAHPRPLLDALDCGFCSIEADVWLTNGNLMVAHDLVDVRPDRTLKTLYLDPLLERVETNGGRVFTGGPSVTLLIDFKSEGDATYRALCDALKPYEKMLTAYRPGRVETNAVTVIISGNAPKQALAAQLFRLAGYDGRPEELPAGVPPTLMPLISDRWSRHFKWRGNGPFPPEEQAKLQKMVDETHHQGKRIRFWAIPDSPAGWRAERDAGVDMINTDRLQELRDFILRQEKD